MSKSNVFPSSERVAIYVIEFAASAGLSSSEPLTTLDNPRYAPTPLIVIVPSTCPQSVGFVEATAEIVGAAGAVKITFGYVTGQEPSALRTLIW